MVLIEGVEEINCMIRLSQWRTTCLEPNVHADINNLKQACIIEGVTGLMLIECILHSILGLLTPYPLRSGSVGRTMV